MQRTDREENPLTLNSRLDSLTMNERTSKPFPTIIRNDGMMKMNEKRNRLNFTAFMNKFYFRGGLLRYY